MKCIICDGEMQLQQTEPERIDNLLIRTGHWECQCGYARPVYQKFPLQFDRDELVKSQQCFCCEDSGAIIPRYVRKYIMDDYQNHDPPVICTRCQKGSHLKGLGWDIATKLQCERIHSIEIKKVNFTPITNEQKEQLQSKIAALSQSNSPNKSLEFTDVEW
ncbi:MAG: hypothetical protein MUE44_32425 [Oscillatoriaceae cyanobacterium Prado104]|jgi:hypothetical protein|nr:hypothetical protein [Oscillatoriaceae cyanobacterium Prado104]